MASAAHRHWFDVATEAEDSITFAFQLMFEHRKVRVGDGCLAVS